MMIWIRLSAQDGQKRAKDAISEYLRGETLTEDEIIKKYALK